MESYHLTHVPSGKVCPPEAWPHIPVVSLMTEITSFLETLQGLQNKSELHCLFIYFCWVLQRLFFWCLQKILYSQECWKVTSCLTSCLPIPVGREFVCTANEIKGKKNMRSLQESMPVNKVPTVLRCVHNTRDLPERGFKVRLDWKNLIPLVYPFVCVDSEFPELHPDVSGQNRPVPFHSFFFSFLFS